MTERRVRFTATAKRHVEHEKSWWLENRAYTEVFAEEIEATLRLLEVFPGVGTPYEQIRIAGLRRLYLRKIWKIDCHLYYTFDEREVLIRALWGARRRRPPRIRP